jgi:hypothetical protein
MASAGIAISSRAFLARRGVLIMAMGSLLVAAADGDLDAPEMIAGVVMVMLGAVWPRPAVQPVAEPRRLIPFAPQLHESYDRAATNVAMGSIGYALRPCPGCCSAHTLEYEPVGDLVTVHCEHGGGIAFEMDDVADVLNAYDPPDMYMRSEAVRSA